MRWSLLFTATLATGLVSADALAGKVNYYGTGGAKLYIDGRYAGTLPMTGELGEGKHTFRVEPPWTDPYEIVRDVRFNGQLALDLPVGPDEPEPASEEAPTDEADEAGDAEPVMVKVKLYAPYGAIIHHDGYELGESPISLTIPEGDYTFKVVNEDGTTFTSAQSVKASGASSVNLTLSP